MTKCENHGELITNQTLESPVEVLAPDVQFEHCKFIAKDPQHTILTTGERTQVHDCELYGDYNLGARRGICVNSPGVIIRTTRIRNIFHAQDAQCIAGWDGTRDLLVEDVYGEASGQSFQFGGDDCQGEDRIPQNITIRRFYGTKLPWWRGKPNGATIKTGCELKNVKNFLVEDCDFSFSWTDGQAGFGIVLSVRNQSGANPYATIEDVVFRRVVSRDSEQGLQVLGSDYEHPSQCMKRVSLESCIFTYSTGNGLQMGNGAEDLSFSKCSWWSGGPSKFISFNNPDKPLVNLSLIDCDANEGWYGILGDDCSPGTPSIEKYAPGSIWNNVSLWRGASGNTYPYPEGIVVY